MEIKFWNQPKDVTLEKLLCEKLERGFAKVYLMAGVAKDSGIETLLPSIEKARSLGTEVNVFIGLDRKNISKDVLGRLLTLDCHLFLHINRDDNKVETRMYLLEDLEQTSFLYTSSGKFSEDGLAGNQCIIQEVSYLPEDSKALENAKLALLQCGNAFQATEEEDLRLLAEKGEIVARITERKIPSISEMFGGTSIEAIASEVYDESSGQHLFEIPQNDVEVEIDVDLGRANEEG